jgi:hypothetical protein
MQDLRRKYGTRPLGVSLSFRQQLLLLSPEDVAEVLKISRGSGFGHEHPDLAPLPDSFADQIKTIVCEEISAVLDCQKAGLFARLDWPRFSAAWSRIVCRLVLGNSAAEKTPGFEGDHPGSFRRQLQAHIDRAEAGSLIVTALRAEGVDAETCVKRWLHAFEPAGTAVFKSLALLASHPHYLRQVREEARLGRLECPFTRACFFEALRLWPTELGVLRLGQNGMLDGKELLIFTPFFHRDDERLPFAHRMEPSIWIDRDVLPLKELVAFAASPGQCLACTLVPLVASLLLGTVVSKMAVRLVSPALKSEALPLALDHADLKFEMNHLPVEPARLS